MDNKRLDRIERAIVYLARQLQDFNHDQYLHKNAVLDILELEEIRDVPKLI